MDLRAAVQLLHTAPKGGGPHASRLGAASLRQGDLEAVSSEGHTPPSLGLYNAHRGLPDITDSAFMADRTNRALDSKSLS